MSKYFSGVDFPELEPSPERSTPDNSAFATEIEWDGIVADIRRMMRSVESGESNIVKQAIMLTNTPLHKALTTLVETPTLDTLRQVLKLAEQDINLRFRRECINILRQNVKLNVIMKENGVE